MIEAQFQIQGVTFGLTSHQKELWIPQLVKVQELFIAHRDSWRFYNWCKNVICVEQKQCWGLPQRNLTFNIYGLVQLKFLLNIESGSTIVVDNTPYHSIVDKNLSSLWKKEEILDRLKAKDINFQEELNKAKLLELCRFHKPHFSVFE